MALTLKQTGTGKTWTSGSANKNEKEKQTAGAVNAPASAVHNRTQVWQYGGLTLTREPQELHSSSVQADAEEKRGFFPRLFDTITGGAKGSLASNTNAFTTLFQSGQAGRTARNQEALEEYSYGLERAKRDMNTMLAENLEKPGTWKDNELKSQQYIIDDLQRKYDAMAKVLGENVQERATDESYRLSDNIQQASSANIERAKEGLGKAGQVIVDAGASMTQMALDAGGNVLLGTPGSMAPFAVRAFGGGAQEARQDGADLEGQIMYGGAQAAKELLTEKMFNLALPFNKVYGGGALDDAVERGIRRAVDRFAKTELGKRALGGALKFGAGAVGEGLEEFIGDWMEWQMPRIYGGDVATAGDTLENSLYDFLVGAASGAMGGAVDPSTYRYDAGVEMAGAETAESYHADDTLENTATEPESILDEAAAQVAQNGAVTNRMAERILADQSAVDTLTEAAGLEVDASMTKSQRRKAVKTAVDGLARSRDSGSEAAGASPRPTQVSVQTDSQTQGSEADNIRRMQQSPSALGENGTKALNAAYDGNLDTDIYYGGFVSYYNAGLAGIDMGKVRSEYGGRLNQAQKFAAYAAGQNDAKVSLARERRAAQYAKVAGTDSGLVFDDYVADALDTATADRVNSVAKSLGVRVRFVDSVRGGTANAQVSSSDILVEKNNTNPVMFLLGHEWTHRMQELAPDQYRAFRDAVMADTEFMDGQIAARQELYARNDVDISSEEAMDEIAADYAGRMIEDGKVLENFIAKNRENRTLLEKVLDAIRDLVRKLTGAERKQAQTAEGKLTAALEASAKQASALQGGQGGATMGATRNSLKEEIYRDGEGAEGVGRAEQQERQSNSERGTAVPDTSGQYDNRKPLYGGSGILNDDFSFGETPKSDWASAGIVRASAGSVVYSEQQVAAEYGVASFAVSDKVWNTKGKKAPAFSREGQLFFRETLPKKNAGMYAIHELTHVMKQVGYQPYLDFVMRTPGMMNLEAVEANILIEHSAKHRNIDVFGNDGYLDREKLDRLHENDRLTLFDELNATLYGHIGSGKIGDLGPYLETAFHDFSAYSSELLEIHERFKKENAKNKYDYSIKGSEQLTREIDQLMKDAKENGRSEAEVRDDIRSLVDEVYQGMVREYGAMKPGERPARDVQVPKRTEKDKKVSQTVRTILEAGATPEDIIPDIEKLVATGAFSYDTYTDKQAISDARNKIAGPNGIGWSSAQREWFDAMKRGEVSKENTAMGWALYNNAANSGDTALALDILDQMVKHQRSAAQALQATRILKKLSPETQLYQAQRSVASLQNELNGRYGDKNGPVLKIDPEMAERFMQAKDQEERDAALRDIYRDIGRQMPSRFRDKWNACRYLAMLGNPRTHVRNVLGNAGFAPVVAAKDMTATAIEAAVYRVSGGKLERSKGAVGFGKKDRALLSAAWGDYSKVQDTALNGGKYSDFANANKYVEEGRVIFRTKALEKARKASGAALDAEDVWFFKPHYAYALAQYCKAHGVTAEQIASGKGLEQARAYAVLEAQKATYRDTNAFSSLVSLRLPEKGLVKNAGKVGNIVLDGILPFRKTPANILVRGVEYSPIGLMNGIKEAVWDVQKGKKTGAEAIDSISAGLTGTGLLALGIYLAAEGLVRGHGGDDDQEKKFEELMGHQAYSLELPNGTSVTLDWLAPECLPFFVGVNLWEQTKGEKEPVTISAMLASITNLTEPLLEMSCLQSLNDVFESVGYASSNEMAPFPAALASAATSYLTQLLPAILGQAERTGEDRRYTTYTEKDAFLTSNMQYTLGRASARIPFWDYQQIPYIDAWGRVEQTGGPGERAFNNFLNPAYTSSIDTSDMERELLRLYRATGEGGVLPGRAAKYITVNGERKDLTAEEYVQYATLKGRKSYDLVTELTRSEQYRSMSDQDKASAVKDAYNLANQEAKAAVGGAGTDSWVQKAEEAEKKYGIRQDVYISLKIQTSGIQSLKDGDGETIPDSKGLLIMEAVYNTPGLSDQQRQAMFEYLGVGKKVRHLNKAAVKEKLEKMRKQAK